MTSSQFEPRSHAFQPIQVWRLDPRDPVVLGDGRTGLPFAEGRTWAFPYPGTLAGMVRTRVLRGESQVGPELARSLLEEIRIRGPWLVAPEARPGTQDPLPSSRLYVPAPADVRLAPGNEDDGVQARVRRLRGARYEEPGPEEGVIWPRQAEGPVPRALCQLHERELDGPHQGAKARSLQGQFWPFSLAVAWALGYRPDASGTALSDGFLQMAAEAVARADASRPFLHKERRVHVVLDDRTGTAEAGLLFSSTGFRLEEHWALALEVALPSEWALESGTHTVQFGGESRTSFLEVSEVGRGTEGAFPPFDPWRAVYEDAARQASGLRIQLLTPAFLPSRAPGEILLHGHGDPAWCPSWLNPLAGGEGVHPWLSDLLEEADAMLRLYAVCLPGHVVVSGWNLQGGRWRAGPDPGKRERTGAPREVRRLVPAGTVYDLEFVGKDDPTRAPDHLPELITRACERLWGGVIDPGGPGEMPGDFRAPAAFDGYGLVLPGCWRR